MRRLNERWKQWHTSSSQHLNLLWIRLSLQDLDWHTDAESEHLITLLIYFSWCVNLGGVSRNMQENNFLKESKCHGVFQILHLTQLKHKPSAVLHAVVSFVIIRKRRSLVPNRAHSWMSIVRLLISWSDRLHTAALQRFKNTSQNKAGFKSFPYTITLQNRDLYHGGLHFAARCLPSRAQCIQLHFLSWSAVISSHPGSARAPVCAAPCQPVSLPPCLLPVCLHSGAQAQFILWRARRQMFQCCSSAGSKRPPCSRCEERRRSSAVN